MVVAVAMLFFGLIAARSHGKRKAADARWRLLSMLRLSGSANCATNPASATYNGTVIFMCR